MNTDKRFPATSDPGQLKTQDITATQPSHVKTKKTKKKWFNIRSATLGKTPEAISHTCVWKRRLIVDPPQSRAPDKHLQTTSLHLHRLRDRDRERERESALCVCKRQCSCLRSRPGRPKLPRQHPPSHGGRATGLACKPTGGCRRSTKTWLQLATKQLWTMSRRSGTVRWPWCWSFTARPSRP